MKPARIGNANKFKVLIILYDWKQSCVCIQPRPENSEFDYRRLTVHHRWKENFRFLFDFSFWICNQYAKKWFFLFPRDDIVGFCPFFDWEAMSDQRLDFNLTACQQISNGLEVASVRPTNVADWIINSVLLIIGVVTARTIGARVDKGNFLFIINFTRDAQTNGPGCDNARAVAGNRSRQFNRIVGRCIRTNNDCVEAAIGGEGLRSRFCISPRDSLNFKRRGEDDTLWVKVNA